MFVDTATVIVSAGDGGNGASSFRHEKFVDKGGPDGGDGGRGGNVIFIADENVNTLLNFRYKQELKADNGTAGSKRRKHGSNGDDLEVKVPVGTVILREGEQYADLAQDGQSVVIAKGGSGGFGNAHFVSSTRQAPRVAELGERGETFEVKLELKLLADVGLVGLPNAGKSTFLSVVSNARPEIGDYAFTTLTPNLGVAAVDDNSILIADIPGLIEGASEGKGLGDAFLRHVERTAVLLHLVDAYSNDIAKDYRTITAELASYSQELGSRPQVVAITKVEGLDSEIIGMQSDALKAVVPKGTPIYAISATAHIGVTPLLRELYGRVRELRAAELAALEAEAEEAGVPVIELSNAVKEEAWQVKKDGERFVITGRKIERFAARTNFDTDAGIQRLRDIMKKMGIMHHLLRNGLEPGHLIIIGSRQEYQFTYQ